MFRKFGLQWVLVIVLLLGNSVKASTLEGVPASERLFTLIHQRLSLMQQIALYKYQQDLPVYVPRMEKEVLEKVRRDAQRLTLPLQETENCFRLQLQLARKVQQSWLEYWHEKGLPLNRTASDIDKVIRPEITRLTTAIIEQIVKAKPELSNSKQLALLTFKIDHLIDVPFVTDAQKHELLQSLIAIAKA